MRSTSRRLTHGSDDDIGRRSMPGNIGSYVLLISPLHGIRIRTKEKTNFQVFPHNQAGGM
jgi:hypothetical protein